MKKVNFSKQNLTRLSMVINAFGNDMEDILTKCIIYIIYNKNNSLSLGEIIDCLKIEIGEFDESEIKNTLISHDEYFFSENVNDVDYFNITGKARILYQHKEKNLFDFSIEKFKKEKNIVLSTDEIKQLVFDYLYKCISVEFNLFNIIIDDNNIKEAEVIDTKAEIINQYFVWAKNKGDDTIYRILMSVLDFCHLSANISIEQIKKFLGNKKFYLDANVIFRLMGINNSERQKSIYSFVEKCKVYDIDIYITSLTDREVKDVFRHYADIICQNYNQYNGKGEINKYLGISDNAFSDLYIKKKKLNGIYSKNEFINDLIIDYERVIKDFNKITVSKASIKITPESKQSYVLCHNNSFEQSIDTDLYNLYYVFNNRDITENTLVNTIGYLITEDKKLIQWSNDNISAFNSVATLPSQWYTLFLSLGGRYISLEEKAAFINFLMIDTSFGINKIDNEDLKKKVIKTINCKVENGEIQDRIYKKLQTLDVKEYKKEENLNEIIKETTAQYNKECEKMGYDTGYSNAIDNTQKDVQKLLNEYLSKEQAEIDAIPKKAHRLRIRNVFIDFMPLVIALILWIINKIQNNNIGLMIIIGVLYGVSQYILVKIFPFKIDECISLKRNELERSNWYLSNREHINSLQKIIKESNVK